MFHYKAPDNSVHVLDSTEFAHLLPDGCTLITEKEAIALAPKAPEPTYVELRAAEYPPITDYLDGIVKGDLEQQKAYISACLAVKEKYPKP